VSLEAIFLSTFVMISQNRADPKRRRSQTSNGRPSRKRTDRAKSCPSSHVRSSILRRRFMQKRLRARQRKERRLFADGGLARRCRRFAVDSLHA
jgi:uncharacterized membrane protein